MRQVLQRPHLVLCERTLPTDMQDRALGAKGRRDAGQRVGEARAGRRDYTAEAACLACVTVCRVRGNLFVTYIDDTNVVVYAAVVDIDDVAAAEREDCVDALVF